MRVMLIKPELARTLPPTESLFTLLAKEIPDEWTAFLGSLDAMERLMVNHDWNLFARPPQQEPVGNWATWVILGGRGFGKTRPGAEIVSRWAFELGEQYGAGHIALIGKDPQDIRKVMIEGESGILACAPPWFKPKFEPSKKQVVWPNGVIASYYSSEEPDQLRGPQHHKLWGDEPCKWKHPTETWDMAMFGLRLGDLPQAVLTTTPRPIPMLLEILKAKGTVVTGGKTVENEGNLSELFLERVYHKYQGTRLGRQELNAELLTDTPGALWTLDQIDRLRLGQPGMPTSIPEMVSLVIGVDPGVTDPKEDAETREDVAETGIVVVGKGVDNHGYVRHDFSDYLSSNSWGTKACTHFASLHADLIVGEVNNGGDMVEFVIRTCARDLGYEVVFKKVTASRGKRVRAEPVSALYEQGRMHHDGVFEELEDQMTTWVPGDKSPDRMDAMVWAATEAMVLSPDELLFR